MLPGISLKLRIQRLRWIKSSNDNLPRTKGLYFINEKIIKLFAYKTWNCLLRFDGISAEAFLNIGGFFLIPFSYKVENEHDPKYKRPGAASFYTGRRYQNNIAARGRERAHKRIIQSEPRNHSSQGLARHYDSASVIAPKNWEYYFPEEIYCPESNLAVELGKLKKFLIDHFSKSLSALEDAKYQTSIRLNFLDFGSLQYGDFLISILRERPKDALNLLSIAATEILSDVDISSTQPEGIKIEKVYKVRIYNYGNDIQIRDLKSHSVGKLVTIKGTVVRVSAVKPLVKSTFFICGLCGSKWKVYFPDTNYRKPTSCYNSQCKSRNIQPSVSSSDVETTDLQQIRVQERLANNQDDAGKIPRNIICELSDDLIDYVIPGDVISVTGTIKPLLSREDVSNKPNSNRVYFLYIDVNIITKALGKDDGGSVFENADYKNQFEFSKRDFYGIQEIFKSKDIFKLLVHSFCPSIYGHEIVKAGVLLTLFGGRRKVRNSKHEPEIRSDIHILVVGDPGLGKSQMLTAACKIASRGVFVCGNSATNSGLTVTMLKDGDTGEPALEAGALILSDQGVCCIDEFDKMDDHSALMEAMEQQSISVAKSGIVCTLPARSSIIASANPVGGHYDKTKSISENIKLSGALLSRFDLVYILLDNPDRDFDLFLSRHVVHLHSDKKENGPTLINEFTQMSSQKCAGSQNELDGLKSHLKLRKNEKLDIIPHKILKKYIAYAKMYAHPVLSKEAKEYIREFYVNARKSYMESDSTPITTRQLESLIRLSEARARAELREVVTLKDAKDATELVVYGIWDTYIDPYGNVELNKSQLGRGRNAEIRKFVEHLHNISSRTGNVLYTYNELEQIANDIRIKTKPFRDLISLLNNQGSGPSEFQTNITDQVI